jgi:hypothetical protein
MLVFFILTKKIDFLYKKCIDLCVKMDLKNALFGKSISVL